MAEISDERLREIAAYQPLDFAITHMELVGMATELLSRRAPASAGEAQIKHMVDRFLSWRLPEGFNPDGGISFERDYNQNTPWPAKHEPVGTNLFDAKQAEAMVRHMLDDFPAANEGRAVKALRELQEAAGLALMVLPDDHKDGIVGGFLAALHWHAASALVGDEPPTDTAARPAPPGGGLKG